jgi:hypothetical protein
MSLLFRLIYAAHANGTHHKLALDALRHLGSPEAERWQRLFLKHAELYLEGAKAPDNEFKDFKNHVLHVRDGYWGGAVDKVESWYLQTVLALKDARWSEAVYAAGILSHYLVDPIHPFHTAQSEAENNIHRAAEWSISKAYADLLHIGEAGPPTIDLAVAEGPSWLRHLVCRSADISNANYERLIAHYDIHRGVVDPPSGLDPIAKAMVGDLIVYAARVHGAVLDRAFLESGAVPPEVDLGVDTVVAALKVPLKWVTKKLADAADRRQVEAMYDELKATGRVEENLPADDRAVRDLHKAEVLSRMVGAMEANRARVVGKTDAGLVSTVKAVPPPARAGARPGPQRSLSAELEGVTAGPVISTGPRPSAPPLIPDPTSATAHWGSSVPIVQPGRPRTTDLLEPQHSSPSVAPAPTVKAASIPAPEAAKPAPQTAALITSMPSRADVPQERPQTIYLSATDDLEKAPSIGPKTAERFASLGLRTVADFLNADPAATASRIDARHITAGVIADWQAQARLVMGVPGLRGTHAQLLIGAGLRTVHEIAAMEPDRLAASVLAFAASPDGQRVLRDGTPPDLDRIKSWCKSARNALAA